MMATLRIHRWCNDYQVAPDHPAPQAACSHLDSLAQRVGESLGDGIDTLFDDQADAIVLLPELEIACGIDSACAPDQIARHWSRQLALALVRALDDPASGVLRFPSRAAYHAHFITELAHGRAWDSWMFRRFEGLRMLPASAAIRTVLTDEVASGPAALALLAPAAWPMLLALLTPREAVRILQHWRGQAASDGGPERARLAAWASAGPDLPGAIAPPLLALYLLAQWARALPPSAPLPLGTACWLAALLTLPAHLTARELRRIARQGTLDAFQATRPDAADPDWLMLLANTRAQQRTAAPALALVLRHAAAPVPTPSPPADLFPSRCAGLAFLLPALLEIFDAGVGAALPASGEGAALDLAALLTLAIASGARAEQVWHDPFWRAFFQLPAAAPSAVTAWLVAADPAPVRQALGRAMARHAPGETAVLRVTHLQAVERGSACRLHAGPLPGSTQETALPWTERLALTRLLRNDARFLASSPVRAALPVEWQDLFDTIAQATLRRTANRIPSAARCSLPYLFANVLGVSGQARRSGPEPGAAWLLELAKPPLHVLLSLNGMARMKLAWPGARSLALHCVD